MKNIPILFVAILFLSAFSRHESQMFNNLQILTNGPWVQTQSLTDYDGDGVFVDVSTSCEIDNTWVFNTDTTMTINDIGDLCAPEVGPITIAGYWGLSSNGKMLGIVLSQGFTQEAFNILSISNTQLILNCIDPNNPNAPPVERFVLQR